MNTLVISYSQTGNNRKLAATIARRLAAEHVTIDERGSRTIGTTIGDLLFNRSPEIDLPELDPQAYELIVFVAPVWMGRIAPPLRAVLARMRNRVPRYAFVSLSGGADGPNTTRDDTQAYRLDDEEANRLAGRVREELLGAGSRG